MLKRLSGIIELLRGGSFAHPHASGRSPRQPFFSRLRAKYDAANTTLDNYKHWSRADGLSAATAKTLNAADPLRHIGLRELVAECARMEGIDVPRVFGDGTATIRAGFSSMSLPSIMENVMNKTLLAAYQNTPIAAFDLCSVGTVTDFKEVARYRLLGTGGFEQVAPDGELKHGKLSEQNYAVCA